jgi:hypothetical protein
MSVKNIECQLAQGQIGRYLAGTNMSSEAVTQLELHLSECEDCSAFVDRKKEELRALAGQRRAAVFVAEPDPTPEPVAPAPEKPRPAAEALLKAIRDKANPLAGAPVLETVREANPPKKTYWKAFGYSAALGLVALAMAHFTANPTALFGERAILEKAPPAAAAPKSEPEKPTASAVADADPFTQDAPANPVSSAEDIAAEDAAGSAVTSPVAPPQPEERAAVAAAAAPEKKISTSSTPTKPRVNVRSRPAPRRTVRRGGRRPSARPQRSGNSIRVYDENGRPISGD